MRFAENVSGFGRPNSRDAMPIPQPIIERASPRSSRDRLSSTPNASWQKDQPVGLQDVVRAGSSENRVRALAWPRTRIARRPSQTSDCASRGHGRCTPGPRCSWNAPPSPKWAALRSESVPKYSTWRSASGRRSPRPWSRPEHGSEETKCMHNAEASP